MVWDAPADSPKALKQAIEKIARTRKGAGSPKEEKDTDRDVVRGALRLQWLSIARTLIHKNSAAFHNGYQVQALICLIEAGKSTGSERGLEFALQFAREFIDAEAVAVVTEETYAWGRVECIGFGANDEGMNVRGVMDWLEFVGGYWVDVVLERAEPSYDGQGSEWVSVDYTSLPNSESHEGDDALKHAMENFEWDVARLGDEFELELVSEQVAGSGQAVAA